MQIEKYYKYLHTEKELQAIKQRKINTFKCKSNTLIVVNSSKKTLIN